MKSILAILAFALSCSSLQAQDPDLFRTWYVNEVQVTDLDPVYIVSDISPEIFPTLTIESNLDFSGDAACNTYFGTWTYDGELFSATELQDSGLECEDEILNNFESAYFSLLDNFYVIDITQESDGLRLRVGTLLLGYAILRDYILPVDDFEKALFNVYPNPVSERLFISSEENVVDGITVYSLFGQQLIRRTGEITSFEVSSLSNGIYLLEIDSKGKRQVKKFIKR